MNNRLRTLCLLLTLLPAWANAQSMYKCRGPDGKTSFSDVPCPGQVSAIRGAPQSKPAVLSPSERQTIAKNMGTSLKNVADLEEQCAKGFRDICQVLETYKTRTAADVMEDNVRMTREACAAGRQPACDALTMEQRLEDQHRAGAAGLRNDLKAHYSSECAAGDQRACKKLSDMK